MEPDKLVIRAEGRLVLTAGPRTKQVKPAPRPAAVGFGVTRGADRPMKPNISIGKRKSRCHGG